MILMSTLIYYAADIVEVRLYSFSEVVPFNFLFPTKIVPIGNCSEPPKFKNHLLHFLCRYAEYQQWKASHERGTGQQTVSSLLNNISSTSNNIMYPTNHPQQTAITAAVISELIVSCNLPMSKMIISGSS